MMLSRFFLAVVFMMGVCCKSQTPAFRVEIVQPTMEHEAASIWRTIDAFTFLEEKAYKIHLPSHPLIDSLIMKSKKGTFGNKDFSSIRTLLETEVFDQGNYQKALHTVERHIASINNLVQAIASKKSQWDWDFKIFDTYRIVLTLYGTGGSYDPDEGIITLMTDKAGGFKKYTNPVNTIIHEIVHIGMELSIVQKYSLSHEFKEKLVDTFVHIFFNEKLPDYKIQNMGGIDIDTYINNKEHIGSLNAILSEFVKR